MARRQETPCSLAFMYMCAIPLAMYSQILITFLATGKSFKDQAEGFGGWSEVLVYVVLFLVYTKIVNVFFDRRVGPLLVARGWNLDSWGHAGQMLGIGLLLNVALPFVVIWFLP